MNKTLFFKLVILLSVLVIACIASMEFINLRNNWDSFKPSSCLKEVRYLSDYQSSLKNTAFDSPVYIFDSGNEGGTVFVMGGTHPNESGAILSTYVLMENLELDKGRVIVLPVANLSAGTTGLAGFGYPSSYTIQTPEGDKTYRVGSRLSNPLDQWPDPVLFVQYPSAIALCYEDARNLNRNYPGRDDGNVLERVGRAIMNLLEEEKVDYAFDLHEASITYPTNHAIITDEASSDLAFLASMLLEEENIGLSVEISPSSLRGFSHQEWGRNNITHAFLIEVPTPFIDRITGPMTQSLITEPGDEFLMKMSDLGFSTVDYCQGSFDLTTRVCMHLSAMKTIIDVGSMMYPEHEIIATWPTGDVKEQGLGSFISQEDSSSIFVKPL